MFKKERNVSTFTGEMKNEKSAKDTNLKDALMKQ